MNTAITFNLGGSAWSGTHPTIEEVAEETQSGQSVIIALNNQSYRKVARTLVDSSTETTGSVGSPSRRIGFDIKGNIGPEWRFIRQLPVVLEFDEDGTYIVSDEIFWLYGAGDTFHEAKQDYLTNLIHYYQVLSESTTDDPQTQALLDYLKQYIREANH